MKKKVGWLLGLSGLVMLLFGLWLFMAPGMSVESAVVVLGAVLFIGGIIKILDALFVAKGSKMSSGIAAGSLASFFIGMIILTVPGLVTTGVILTFSMLAFMLAFVALVWGLGQIYCGLEAKKGKALPFLTGAIFFVLALFMLLHPLAAGVGLIMAIGIYFVLYGLVLMLLAFNLRKLYFAKN